jgi:hypothetical protein
MGCDIHLFVEVRSERTKSGWELAEDDSKYGDWGVGRNYLLFARLAGVRAYANPDVLPIAEPRGLPDDANAHVRRYMDPSDRGADLHSRSYFTLNELSAADWPEGLEWVPEEFLVRLADLRPSSDDVRIVFAFDN